MRLTGRIDFRRRHGYAYAVRTDGIARPAIPNDRLVIASRIATRCLSELLDSLFGDRITRSAIHRGLLIRTGDGGAESNGGRDRREQILCWNCVHMCLSDY